MGIIVPEAILPSSNIAVSNVYMSFSGEAVQVLKNPYTSEYILSSNYRVFSNTTKQPETNIAESLMVPYLNLDEGPFTVLYTALKNLYPGSEDSLVNYIPPAPEPTSVDIQSAPEPTSNVISE